MTTSLEQVNVGVIGAGAIGLNHVESFQAHESAKVLALAETNEQRAQEAADEFGIPKTYADYTEILARDDIDVVSVALPNFLHAKVGLEVLESGKHLMLEKPMATNASEAEAIVNKAKELGLKLMIGQNQRFTPEAQTVKRLVQEGGLGRTYHAKAAWMRRSGIPRMGTWFTQKQFAGGGCVYDIGVHALDLILHLMGDFDAVSVSGQTYAEFGPRGMGEGTWGKSEPDPDKPFDVDDFATALIRMRSGATVQLDACWAAFLESKDKQVIQLFGTEAGVSLMPFQRYFLGEEDYETEDMEVGELIVPDNRMVHFIDLVLGKAEPFVKPEESLAVQRILDAIYESSATGCEVQL